MLCQQEEMLKQLDLLPISTFPRCDTITDPLKKIELFKALASPAFIGDKKFMSCMKLNSHKRKPWKEKFRWNLKKHKISTLWLQWPAWRIATRRVPSFSVRWKCASNLPARPTSGYQTLIFHIVSFKYCFLLLGKQLFQSTKGNMRKLK